MYLRNQPEQPPAEIITEPGCCDDCAARTGQFFNVDDYAQGVNAPPFHPNCRCGVQIYVAESIEEDDQLRGNYSDYLDAIGFRESSNRYDLINRFGFMGRYQIGKPALRDIGWMNGNEWTAEAAEYGVASQEDFLANPAAQDAAIELYHQTLWRYLANYGMTEYIGQTYQGIEITASGLIAGAHLVGAKGLSDAIKNDEVITDANKTPAHSYMELFGGYEIPWID